jgi:hypothetical protein
MAQETESFLAGVLDQCKQAHVESEEAKLVFSGIFNNFLRWLEPDQPVISNPPSNIKGEA